MADKTTDTNAMIDGFSEFGGAVKDLVGLFKEGATSIGEIEQAFSSLKTFDIGSAITSVLSYFGHEFPEKDAGGSAATIPKAEGVQNLSDVTGGITSAVGPVVGEIMKMFGETEEKAGVFSSGIQASIESVVGILDTFLDYDSEQTKVVKDKSNTWQEQAMAIGAAIGGLSSAIVSMVDAAAAEGFQEEQSEIDEDTEGLDEKQSTLEEEVERRKAANEEWVEYERTEMAKLQKDREDIDARQEDLDKRKFEQKKKVAIANAVIQTSLAVLTAFATNPLPVAIATALIATAIGATQIAMIASQPYPGAAFGGIIPAQPPYGGLYRVGEVQSEAIIPLDRLDDYTGGGGKGYQIVYTYHNYNITVQGSVIETDVANEFASMVNSVQRTEELIGA